MADSSRGKSAVKVWFAREGANPTDGGPAYSLPLDSCVKKLGLLRTRRFAELGRIPRIGNQDSKLAAYRNPRYVLCEVDESTVAATGWKSGFYLLELSPKEVVSRLGEPSTPWKT